jgi:hypothetical protein
MPVAVDLGFTETHSCDRPARFHGVTGIGPLSCNTMSDSRVIPTNDAGSLAAGGSTLTRLRWKSLKVSKRMLNHLHGVIASLAQPLRLVHGLEGKAPGHNTNSD